MTTRKTTAPATVTPAPEPEYANGLVFTPTPIPRITRPRTPSPFDDVLAQLVANPDSAVTYQLAEGVTPSVNRSRVDQAAAHYNAEHPNHPITVRITYNGDKATMWVIPKITRKTKDN